MSVFYYEKKSQDNSLNSIHFTTTSSIKNDRVNGIYFSVDNISIDGLYNEQKIGLNFTIHYLTNQPGIYENGFQSSFSSCYSFQFSDCRSFDNDTGNSSSCSSYNGG